MPITLVLAIGLDALSLGIRHSLLQSAGYIVVSALSLKEAASLFLNGDYDLVLLDKSLPKRDRDRIASFIRVSGSRIPVVSIGSEPAGAEMKHDHPFVDAMLDEQPDSLLRGIRSVLVRTATSPAPSLPAARDERQVNPAAGKRPPRPRDFHRSLRQNPRVA